MTRSLLVLLSSTLLLLGCTSSGGGGRSTSDARVRSFMGQTPPAVTGGLWLKPAPAPESVRASFVVFAFPT